jgi:hypothetical protein
VRVVAVRYGKIGPVADDESVVAVIIHETGGMTAETAEKANLGYFRDPVGPRNELL